MSHTLHGTIICDDFDDGVFNDSIWQVVDQDGDASSWYTEKDGTLQMGGPGGTLGWLTIQHLPELGVYETVQIGVRSQFQRSLFWQ